MVSGVNSSWQTLDSEIISFHKSKHMRWVHDFGQQGMTGCINSEGKIILIGGETFDHLFEVTKSKDCHVYNGIKIYDPTLIKMLNKRAWSSAILLSNEMIWVVGGEDNENDLCSTELPQFHRFLSQMAISQLLSRCLFLVVSLGKVSNQL